MGHACVNIESNDCVKFLFKLDLFCSDLERIGNSLSKLDTQHTVLGKSGLLFSDPIQDKTPLYDQLMQTYSWTQKVIKVKKAIEQGCHQHIGWVAVHKKWSVGVRVHGSNLL